jgi:hypothetical protein
MFPFRQKFADFSRVRTSVILPAGFAVCWLMTACAAYSGGSVPKVSRTSDGSANSSSASGASAKAGSGAAAPAAAGVPSAKAKEAKKPPDPNEHRCNVSISRGKIGGTNKASIARIEMAPSQDTSGAQLIRRTKENTTEYVEAGAEFGKDALPAGVYDLEFRRDDGTWCPLKIEVTQGDIDDAVILFLNIRFL